MGSSPRPDAVEAQKQFTGIASTSSTADTTPVSKPKHDDEASKQSLGQTEQEPRHEPVAKKRRCHLGGQSLEDDADSDNAVIQRMGHDPALPNGGLAKAEEPLERMCGAIKTLLECVGEDPAREGLLDTPLRYAKALMFLTRGYREDVSTVVNNAFFYEHTQEMVVVKDIEIHSLCEHHLLPFTGKMHIGYIPSDTVIGLSKLPRIAEIFARRLQIQERLTREVAHAIKDALAPQGVAVVMEASHLCMEMRGVRKRGTTTITCCFLDGFERDTARNEFLTFIGVGKT